MYIKQFEKCEEIIAGDKTVLRELLHPERDNVKINHSIAHAMVKPGNTSAPHKLKNAEIYFILDGQGKMFIDEESADVKKGDAIYIPPQAVQYIKNTGDSNLCFICTVDPAWRKEDEEVINKST